MSIPRAKITKLDPRWPGLWLAICDGCGLDVWGTDYWPQAVHEAREHLRDTHGVRTVGSLTADDIGKWVEVEGHEPVQIGCQGVSHEKCLDPMTAIYLKDGSAIEAWPGIFVPSSTPCRVTEERPDFNPEPWPWVFHVTHLDPFTRIPGCPGCDQYLDRNNRPSETLPAGQVWVWLAGATPPHWEPRGTGVIVPEELRRNA